MKFSQVALLVATIAAATAAAQTPPGDKPPGITTFKDERKAEKGPKGPSFKLPTRPKREAMAAALRDASIDQLLEIVELECGDNASPECPKTLITMAQQYWEKGEDFYYLAEELQPELIGAEDAKNQPEVDRLTDLRNRLFGEMKKWHSESVKTYQQIEREHPTFKDLDQVLFALGYLLSQMGDRDEGYQYYAKLVLQRPNSDRIPDAYLNIGDYFFDTKNDFQQALLFFEKVKQFGDTSALGYAIYKSGWCWYNLDDKAKALNLFYETVQWTKAQEAKGVRVSLDLRKDALTDMVRAYADIGTPGKAVAFFKKTAADIYVQLCETLAQIYTADANYHASSQVYELLVNEVGDTDPRATRYQREVVYNTFKGGDKTATKKQVDALSERYRRVLPAFSEAFKKEELVELEELLRIIGTDYHKTSEATRDKPTQLLAVAIYEIYLEWFPDAKDAYVMTFNTAVLAEQMGDLDRAARLYEKVIAMDAAGLYTAPAAHQACLCRYKTVLKAAEKAQGSKVKKEGDPDGYNPREIPSDEQRLVDSCSKYIELAKVGQEGYADDVPPALYAVSSIYFEYNHFEQAAPLFQRLYGEYRVDAIGKGFLADAAKMLLAIYNLSNDIDNLYKWTDTFSRDPDLAKGEFGQLLSDIQAKRDFNVCRKMEFEKRYTEAGDCFMKYFKDFPTAKDRCEAVAKAAIVYKDARNIEKALGASETLYNDCNADPRAPQALYNIGQIYQAIAVYSEAAYYYELYAQNHGNHDETLLGRALGQYEQAIKDSLQFYKRFPKNADAGDIYFDIGLIYESQQNWKAVTKHFTQYLKQYGSTSKPDYVIAAHAKMGIAHWRGGNRKAALAEFATALSAFNDLQAKAKAEGRQAEITEGGLDSVAASKFFEGEVVLDELKKVELKLPEKVFQANLQKKLELISSATDRMQEVAQFGRPHWEIAAFNRIGQAYQNLSESIENAPIPKNLPEDVKFEVQEEFRKRAEEVRNKSVEAYRICLERAKEKQWFNEYSDNCEQAVAKLDLEYKFTREVRPLPTFYRHNATVPFFLDAPAFKATLDAAREIRDWTAEKDRAEAVAKGFADASVGEDEGKGLVNQALVALRLRQFDKALELLTDAQAKAPSLAQAFGLEAETRQRLGRSGWETAAARATALDKFQSEALNTKAVTAVQTRDWSAVTVAARTALIGNAENLNAYQNLARSYYETGQYRMALLVCEEALKFAPDAAALHNLLGLTFIKLDDVRGALRSFVKAVETEPSSVEGHLNLASTVLNYADFARARKHYDVALRFEGDNQDALLGRAVALRGLADFVGARADYDVLFKAQPQNVDLRYNKCLLLAIYEEKIDEAIGVCSEFVAMAPPTHPKRVEITKRLEGLKQTLEFLKQEEEEKKNAPPAETPAEPPAEAAPEAPASEN